MSGTLVTYIGISDIAFGALATWSPHLLYDNPCTRFLNGLTGFKVANPSEGPGFNQGIAMLVASIGVAHLVGARQAGSGADGAQSTLFALNAALALSSIFSSVFQKQSGLACTMTLIFAVVQSFITLAMYQGLSKPAKKK